MRALSASLLLIGALIAGTLPLAGHGDDSVRSGTSATGTSTPRAPLEGTALYYAPDTLEKVADTISLMTYATPQPGDDGTEYLFNCTTREYTLRTGGKGSWAVPMPLIANQALYPAARKLCDWGPGVFKKLAK